ncbi:DNA internalization-related competence protein ComEC/Rec2 [Paenibacillus thermoaerophilus]|uniref:DNA internalization-related competence protein ComEC/Rec2 n=1 Tax=Paenibacillus thermoaerophilus TaxID=1215385 RepID=A0ABW2V0R8_9BACL|nr:DNA internalization-related competence protein ComEC/Rec2 [Paenibacillus thermoaerophilus]TMV18977.1 DNA internalization-related competence protein ComEC/Rec2 [Paenibacillus thermoaerophilus]
MVERMTEAIRSRPLPAGAAAWTAGTAIGLGWQTGGRHAAAAGAALVLLLAVWARVRSFKAAPIALWAALASVSGVYAHALDERNVSALPAAFGADDAEALNGMTVRAIGTIDSPVEVDGDLAAFRMKTERMAVTAEGGGEAASGARGELLQVRIRLRAQSEQAAALRWGRGDRLELAGALKLPNTARNEGGFDYRSYLRQQGIHWQLAVDGTESVRAGPAKALGLYAPLQAVDDVRQLFSAKLDALFGEDQGGYMKGLIVGIRDDIDPERYSQFAKLGLTHILAISGMHVAVFLFAVLAALRMFGLTRETQLTAAMIAVPGYVAFSGAAPSVVRAGLMAMIGLQLAKRRKLKDGLHVLAAALWLMLLWNPYSLLDVGFQLSFLVTAGLIGFVPRVLAITGWSGGEERAERPAAEPGPLAAGGAARVLCGKAAAAAKQALAVTVVAQLVSFPVTVYYFNQFSLWSFAANLVLVPYISLIVLPAGTLSMLAGFAWEPAGRALASLVRMLNDASFSVIGFAARIEAGTLIWATPPGWWVAAYYAALTLIVSGLLRFRREPGAGAGRAIRPAALLAVLLAVAYWPPERLGREATVHFLDVGQGDAILIRTPDDRNLLIDGGGTLSFLKPGEEWKRRDDPFEVGRKLLVPLLKKRGVRHLDLVVATHFDQDHVGGLQAVLEEIPSDRLLVNGTWKDAPSVRKLLETALGRGVKLLAAEPGATWQPDRDTRLTVLAPPGASGRPEPRLIDADHQNRFSVVLLAEIHGVKLLLTGDMTEDEERAWLETAEAAGGLAGRSPVDIAKIAHHGSKTSTSAEWLAAWKPRNAVISAGVNNVYGHPHPAVTARIVTSGARLWRTDESGEITVRIGPDGYSVAGFLDGGRTRSVRTKTS